MAEGGPAPPDAGTRGDAIGLRLALAFAAVALAAIALLAGLTAAFAAADVSSLASRQRSELTRAIAAAAGTAWDRNHSWSQASVVPGAGIWRPEWARTRRYATRPGGPSPPPPTSPCVHPARSSCAPSWCTVSG
jgi:hypothetical protein